MVSTVIGLDAATLEIVENEHKDYLQIYFYTTLFRRIFSSEYVLLHITAYKNSVVRFEVIKIKKKYG